MKRSFGSNSSSASGSNKKTKKKTNSGNQKTLGAAWGAASSRSSFRSSSPFSDFGSYMEVKNRKIQNQYEAEAASASNSSHGVSGSEKLIFQGVSIFVDGFTIPSHQELRGYMMKHGGKFQNYFSRRSVTHIICSNLPDSKVKNLRAFSRGLPVVKPTWIVDSISANRLLGWALYQLDQLNDAQPKLSAFFAPKSNLTAQLSSPVTSCLPEAEHSEAKESSAIRAEDSDEARDHIGDEIIAEDSEEERDHVGDEIRAEDSEEERDHTDGKIREKDSEEARDHVGDEIRAEDSEEERDHVDGEVTGFYIAKTTPEMTEGTRIDDLKSSEVNAERLQPTTILHSTSDKKLFHDRGKNDGKSNATAVGSSIRRHSTLEDPNFVENYFKNSRLHFIGTWRNRYRKRFHGSSSGSKWADSGQNTDENATKSTIIHIDLDSFFVSVVIRNRHELHDKPVAVCHSDNPKGTAEISSANYPARAYGVKAGMFVRHAKDLCPQLVIVPYNFEAYEEVADQFYDILHRHCRKVQAVSCDEAFLDVSDVRDVEPELLASKIRKEILEASGCSASAGIGGTMLMARLATRVAKPAGQFYISAEEVDEFLDQLPVGTLPGVGSVLKEKLEKQSIQTCGQLRVISKDSLQKDFGVKTGEMLWAYSRGQDLRSVTAVQESKSIGAEVNWGVRFRDQQDIQHFLHCLCKEVSLRLQGCEMIGRTFTLKIKKRKKDAEEPAKYMGCGDCDNLSRSVTVPAATDDVEVLQRVSKKLFGSVCLDVKEVRGVGLQVSKLESADASNKGSKTLTSWLTSASASVQTERDENIFAAKVRESSDCKRLDTGGVSRVRESNSAEPSVQSGDTNSSLPAMCHLDIEVLENLPPEVLSELDETYGGKLFELIEKKRGKRKMNNDSPHVSSYGKKGSKSFSDKLHGLNTKKKDKVESCVPCPSTARRSYDSTIEMTDLIPISLSQVDVSVLQELPDELRADVLGAFPAHRKQQPSSDDPMEECKKQDTERIDVKDAENPFSNSSLWFGNPPQWTENFKVSGNCTLAKLSEIYCKVAELKPMLSSVLQHAISESGSFHNDSDNDMEKPVHDVCELLKQYIKLKVERDIEEIYLCFRLMKRLAAKSHFFLQIDEILSPFIQASITEHYGGSLSIH